jgi:4'-phosphopantetheinyl transferase
MSRLYYFEQTTSDVPQDNSWLSPREQGRLNQFRFEKRRCDWRLGRWTAKQAVAAYFEMRSDPAALRNIEIVPAASGAPEVFLADRPVMPVISLSHCDGVALCAVADAGTMLGCDVEAVDPRTDTFVADYFTAEEQTLLTQSHAAMRWMLATLLWSAKESALKALGEGLRLDTRSVSVSLEATSPAEDQWQPLRVRYLDRQVFEGWWRRTGNLIRTLAAAPSPALPVPLVFGTSAP